MATTLVSDSIAKYVRSEDGTEFSPSFVVDGDKLAAMSDVDLFKVYRSCKAARAARIIIFYELQRRGKVGGKTIDGVPALNRFFADYGLNYDTEYKFVYRDKLAIEAELNPPKPDLPKPEELKPLVAGDTVFEKTNLERPLVVKEDSQTTRESVVLDQSGDDEPVEKIVPRADLITLDEKVAASTKTFKPTCKKCAKLEAKIETLEEKNAALIETHKKKVAQLEKALDDLRVETRRKVAELKDQKRNASAAKLDKPSGTKRVGDKSEPHCGFYWEFRKVAKPYGIFSTNTQLYGTAALCECNSESEALTKIREYAVDPTIVGKAASA